MHTRMLILILTPAHPTPCGRGGVAGDGAEAEVAGLAGDGLCPTGTLGGKAGTYSL
jgi:hypothetical protein